MPCLAFDSTRLDSTRLDSTRLDSTRFDPTRLDLDLDLTRLTSLYHLGCHHEHAQHEHAQHEHANLASCLSRLSRCVVTDLHSATLTCGFSSGRAEPTRAPSWSRQFSTPRVVRSCQAGDRASQADQAAHESRSRAVAKPAACRDQSNPRAQGPGSRARGSAAPRADQGVGGMSGCPGAQRRRGCDGRLGRRGVRSPRREEGWLHMCESTRHGDCCQPCYGDGAGASRVRMRDERPGGGRLLAAWIYLSLGVDSTMCVVSRGAAAGCRLPAAALARGVGHITLTSRTSRARTDTTGENGEARGGYCSGERGSR